MPTRREFIRRAGGTAALAGLGGWALAGPERKRPLNVLLFTADDLHCRSVGCFGGRPKGLTPNLDRFAGEGMRFHRAHVNAAICMPSRMILGTGLYGHNSGAMGFRHARPGTPNVVDLLRRAGYLAGVLGKVEHSTPLEGQKWDYAYDRGDLGDGRDPALYHRRCTVFFERCKREKKPFYLMVNSHDPHRPFHVAGRTRRGSVEPSRTYKPGEVPVPPFLPDLPGVRRELANYLNSTRRLDDTFGRVMAALERSGFADNTLVLFLSDNGIAVPFAKANCYLASTLTPWIVRWPGVVRPGGADRTHFVSGVDFLPTVLEATGVKAPAGLDGRSTVPLLKGGRQKGREAVFTQIDWKISGPAVPMRCVQDGRYGYIFNAWSDGELRYRNNNEGRTLKAMVGAAARDPAVAARVRMYRYRAPEEFYDLQADPGCTRNLIADPKAAKRRTALVARLRAWMVETGDPALAAFDKRGDRAACRAAMRKAFTRGKTRPRGKSGTKL